MNSAKPTQTDRKSTSQWKIPALFLIWVGLIFGTSCTVIRPDEFFRLIAKFTGAGQESMEKFAIFWGVAWFAVVKGWHVTEFILLTFFSAAVLRWWFGALTTNTIGASMLFCFVFAASDEWHQTFVPDRFGTVQDVFIDGLGICIAGVAMLIRLRRRNAQVSNAQVSSAPIEALAATRELGDATAQDFDRQK